MKLKMLLVSWLLFCLLISGLVSASQDTTRPLTLVYMGNLDGELEPCGCSLEGNLGGVLRHIATMDAWREAQPELFLISSGGLIVSNTPHDKITGEFILKGYEQMGFDAIGVQWTDRSYGDDFLKPFNLPWVSSNGGAVFLGNKEISRADIDMAVYSWLDPGLMQDMAALADRDQALAAMREGLRQAKEKKQTTVLLTALSLAQVKQLLPLTTVDIVLIKSSYEVYGEPMWEGRTLVLQPGSRGMRFARLDAEVDANGSLTSFSHKVTSLPPEVIDSPRMLAWYAAYTDKLKEEYQASVELKKKLTAQGSPYAGAKTCQACHTAAYDTWRGTKHAKAYNALVKVNKAFDSACVACHVVGFEKPGGFIDSELTRNLANVQCESCHGAGAAHVESAGAVAMVNKSWSKEQMCEQCHVQKHSPSFNVENYWQKINH